MGKNSEGGGIDLAKAVTEDQLTQKRKAAVNPRPCSTADSSYRIVRNSILKRREKVYLNVYNLVSCNKCLCACGLTINHSSIELFGMEFAFGGHPGDHSGVFETRPFHELVEDGILPPMLTLKERTLIGITPLSYRQVMELVDELADDWPGNSYDLLRRNCNNFADVLGAALIKGYNIPKDVNRIARVGACVSCCLPKVLAHTVWSPEYELWGRHGRKLGTYRGGADVVPGCQCKETKEAEANPERTAAKSENARLYAGAAAISRWEARRGRPRFPSARRENDVVVPIQLRMDADQEEPAMDGRRQPLNGVRMQRPKAPQPAMLMFSSELQLAEVAAGRRPIEVENRTTAGVPPPGGTPGKQRDLPDTGDFGGSISGQDPRDINIAFQREKGGGGGGGAKAGRRGSADEHVLPAPPVARSRPDIPAPAGTFQPMHPPQEPSIVSPPRHAPSPTTSIRSYSQPKVDSVGSTSARSSDRAQPSPIEANAGRTTVIYQGPSSGASIRSLSSVEGHV